MSADSFAIEITHIEKDIKNKTPKTPKTGTHTKAKDKSIIKRFMEKNSKIK